MCRGLQANDPVVLIYRHEPAADVDCGGLEDVAVAHKRELAGAAADVDVQQGVAALVG